MQILHDSIGIFRNACDPSFCSDLIAQFNAKEQMGLRELGGGEPEDGSDACGILWRRDQKRIDVSCDLNKFGSLREHVNYIEQKLSESANEYFLWFAQRQSEWDSQATRQREGWHVPTQPMVYKMQKTYPKGGFCQFHHEQGRDLETASRYAVWMLYLNDVERGGHTDFPAQRTSIQPTEGTIVIWPAAYTHPHRSAPDLGDTKYIVTGWFEHPLKGEDCGCKECEERAVSS